MWSKRPIASGGGSNVQDSTINGRIIVDGQEITVYDDTELRSLADATGVVPKLKNKVWNALGDSITNGQGTTKQYHSYIKDWEQMALVRNYGVSGRKISGTNGMAERYVDMDNTADLVTLLGGINDINDGAAALGTFADRTVATFYGACHVLFSGLRAKYPAPTTRIVVFTPMMFDAFPLVQV
jgi:lysophospholipase L1-like esterase